jgi:hypothetical protein
MLDNETIHRIAAAASGSAIAAAIARATGFTLVWMFGGGLSAALFVGPIVAEYFRLSHQQAGVGFAVGFLAIMIMRKIHDVFESIPAGSVGGTLVRGLQRVLGLQPDGAKKGDE